MKQNNTTCEQQSDNDINHIFQALTLNCCQIPTKKQQKPESCLKTCKNTPSQLQPCQSCQKPILTPPPTRTHALTPICKRCKKLQSIFLNKTQQICKQCLLKNIEYKTRLYLQNKIKINSKKKLLICFSGGLNSICLTYILLQIKNKYQKNPLFGPLQCIHIQQQSKLPHGYQQKFQQITSFKLNILPIESIYGKQSPNKFQNIHQLFSSFRTNSNSIDLLVLFRNKLIIQFAKQNQFDYILLGNNGESFSSEVFKYFTKGVGGSVSELSGSQPGPFQYPLSQHLLKQLQYYFYHHKLSKLSMIASSDDLSHTIDNQIDSCLNQFITTLQSKYSHTAPAIVRASQKIKSNFTHSKQCKWCWLKHDQQQELCQKCTRLRENIKDQQILKRMPQWTIL